MLPLRWLIVIVGIMRGAAVAAHDLGAEVRLLGDHLEVKAFFDDGTWARQAKVELLGADDRKIVAQARTDDKGRALLARPAPGKYLLRVNAGAGHLYEEQITVPPGNVQNHGPPNSTDTSSGTVERAVLISTGPSYEEKTRFPWFKLSIGLLTLIGLALVAWFALRQRANA
ncbi:MAG: hypothetical protein RMI91_14770 [Gemmatales bacterium]|nr:hypothetical protein [Gemmatales bacterium]MDW7995908.1 hypothetical protein [Gemmatales bacterium]